MANEHRLVAVFRSWLALLSFVLPVPLAVRGDSHTSKLAIIPQLLLPPEAAASTLPSAAKPWRSLSLISLRSCCAAADRLTRDYQLAFFQVAVNDFR
jgi:hypothetical protein